MSESSTLRRFIQAVVFQQSAEGTVTGFDELGVLSLEAARLVLCPDEASELGYGRLGLEAVDYLTKQGHEVFDVWTKKCVPYDNPCFAGKVGGSWHQVSAGMEF